MMTKKRFSKDEMIERIKGNEELLDFVNSISKEEISRIKEIRRFDMLKPNTNRYKVALLNDQLRINKAQHLTLLKKRLWNISDAENKIHRLKVQLASKNITEQLRDGMTMTEQELESLIQQTKWLQEGEFNAIRKILADLNGLVGHVDYIRNVIVTENSFNKIVEDTETELRKFGFELFGELNE